MDGTDFPVTGGKYKKDYVTNTVTTCPDEPDMR